MPRSPKGEKRPADVIGGAIMVGNIAISEIKDGLASPELEKDPAAVALGVSAAEREQQACLRASER